MITVMKIQGKGLSNADYVSVYTFDDKDSADKFVEENTKDGKYWSIARIVEFGEVCDTYKENF